MVLITSLGNSGAKMNSISHMDNHAVHDGSYCWHVAFLDSPQFWKQSSGDGGGSGIADCMTLSRTLRMTVVNAAISASLFSDIQTTRDLNF